MTIGLLVTAATVIAQTASQWIDFRLFHLRQPLLDSDHHASIFGALSILAEAAAAVVIGLCAVSTRVSTRRLAGLFVAVLVGVLIIPRALMRYVPAFQHYDVPALAVPLTVSFFLLCALTFRDPRRVRFMVWGSLALLTASFALHAVGPQADSVDRPYLMAFTWSYQLTGMFKHALELGGWMLLTTGMAAVLSSSAADGVVTSAVGHRPGTPTPSGDARIGIKAQTADGTAAPEGAIAS